MSGLAELLAVAAQELVGLDENAAVVRELDCGGRLRGAVGLRVTFLFLAVAEPQEDAQAVGVEGEYGKTTR
jgi:hypothetical protein